MNRATLPTQPDIDRTTRLQPETRTSTSVTITPGMTPGDIVRLMIAVQNDIGRPTKLGFMGGGVDIDGNPFVTMYFERIGE